MPDAVPEVPRCEKIKRSGLRCGRKAVPGSIHCWNHSAIALQAEAATAQADCRGRLIEAADKAVGALIGLLDAEDEGIRLRATTAVLDRLGVSVVQRIEGTVEHVALPGPVERSIDQRIAELLAGQPPPPSELALPASLTADAVQGS